MWSKFALVRQVWILKPCLYLFMGTAGTQCLATSAPFPFKTRTDLMRSAKHESPNITNIWEKETRDRKSFHLPDGKRKRKGPRKLAWGNNFERRTEEYLALAEERDRAERPNKVVIVYVRGNAVSFLVDINNAAIWNAGGRQNVPLHESPYHLLKQEWQWIYGLVMKDSRRVTVLVLKKVEQYEQLVTVIDMTNLLHFVVSNYKASHKWKYLLRVCDCKTKEINNSISKNTSTL